MIDLWNHASSKNSLLMLWTARRIGPCLRWTARRIGSYLRWTAWRLGPCLLWTARRIGSYLRWTAWRLGPYLWQYSDKRSTLPSVESEIFRVGARAAIGKSPG